MIFYITNIALDFSLGVLWWVTKNTTLGVYNGIYYIKDNMINSSIDNNNNEIIMDYIIMDYNDFNKIENIKRKLKKLE